MALKTGTPAEIETACRGYYRHPDHRKEGGEFAMGAARLLMADRWRDYLPSAQPDEPLTPEVERHRLQTFHETGQWREAWGPRPQRSAA